VAVANVPLPLSERKFWVPEVILIVPLSTRLVTPDPKAVALPIFRVSPELICTVAPLAMEVAAWERVTAPVPLRVIVVLPELIVRGPTVRVLVELFVQF